MNLTPKMMVLTEERKVKKAVLTAGLTTSGTRIRKPVKLREDSKKKLNIKLHLELEKAC